jgi:hypothetical protein
MYKDLIRKLKNALLTGSYRDRRDAAVSAYREWKAGKAIEY